MFKVGDWVRSAAGYKLGTTLTGQIVCLRYEGYIIRLVDGTPLIGWDLRRNEPHLGLDGKGWYAEDSEIVMQSPNTPFQQSLRDYINRELE